MPAKRSQDKREMKSEQRIRRMERWGIGVSLPGHLRNKKTVAGEKFGTDCDGYENA